MFEFEEYNQGDLLWLGDWSLPWIIALLALGVIVVSISAYDLRPLKPPRRWLLVGLRAAVYLLAVLLLLEPAIDLKHVSRVQNDVAVLVDTSRSMSLGTEGNDQSRAERARAALETLDRLAERSSDDHHFHFFGVAEDLTASTSTGLQSSPADGAESDLSDALTSLSEVLDVENLGGVVLISDGIDTGAIGERVRRGAPLDTATLDSLASLGAPVNTISVADDAGLRDLAVADILHDDFAFVHNKVTVDLDLAAIGVEPTTLPVSLYRGGQLVQTRRVTVDRETTRERVTFEFVPQRIGKEVYSVSVPELDGEVLLKNNVGHFLLNVIRDKIRVLQVVGRPTWDERFLRRLLKQNPNVDLISFFILRTDMSVRVARNDELSLIPFPTRELFEDELGSFDLVIFQNFNFGPYNMRRYLPEIADFVDEGGGFVMIGGDLSFASGGYAGTPIERILPVELPSTSADLAPVDLRVFRPEVTPAGSRHPITQLAFDPVTNRELWSALPNWKGTNVVGAAKPGATVLTTHPDLRSLGKPMPTIAVQEVGEGRSMAVTGDSTWRWAFERVGQDGTNREYQVFWTNAIRWLIRDPALKLVRVEFSEDTAPPGSTASARISAAQPDYSPDTLRRGQLEVTLEPLLASPGATDQTSKVVGRFDFQTDHRGEAQVDVPITRRGVYRVRATVGDRSDETIILAVDDVDEFREIVPRNDLLKAIAAATDASHQLLPRFDDSALELREPSYVQVNRRKVIQLWDHTLLFVVILGLLGAEWALRRRWGRL